MPARLAFCITDLDSGGAERALVQIVTRLDRQKWEPLVVCLSGPGALVETLAEAHISVKCLGARRARHVSVLPRLVRQLREWRPDLLQTFLFHANIAGRIAGRLTGVRHIVSGIRVAERRSRKRLWLDRATEWMVERHVCVSRDVAEFSIRDGRLSPEKVIVIPNGVDVDRFASAPPADLAEFGIPARSRVILSVGRLDPQKGPDVLLEAFLLLASRYAAAHLLLVGSGPMADALQRAAREYGLEQRVHFAGWRGDVPELMRAASILALPSRWEGMPNVVLEAMAAGLPVVASRVEGIGDLVRDGETGRLVEPDHPDAVAAALGELLADSGRRSAMGLAAQTTAAQQLSWDRVAAAYDELYTALLAGRGLSAPVSA